MTRSDGLTLFEIWAEGFRTNGESGTAQLLGTMLARTFAEAVALWAQDSPSGSYVDRERLTFWGCKLYDNEQDARRSFG